MAEGEIAAFSSMPQSAATVYKILADIVNAIDPRIIASSDLIIFV